MQKSHKNLVIIATLSLVATLIAGCAGSGEKVPAGTSGATGSAAATGAVDQINPPATLGQDFVGSMPPIPTYQDDSDCPPLLLVWCIENLAFYPYPPVVGKPVEIWADIYNEDLVSGYVGVHLLLNGEALAYQRCLVCDEITSLHFDYIFNEPGSYEVSMLAAMEVDPASLFGLTRMGNFVSVYGEVTVKP